MYELKDEDLAVKALQVAEEKVAYKRYIKTNRDEIIKTIQDFFRQDGRVKKAWIFGSFARGDDDYKSDIDIMVSFSEKASGTLFDYADIQYKLQNILKRRIDLAEEGYIKPFAFNSIQNDLKVIYG
jgi:predicted nucleotidyltransferase